jgi:mannose-6-phosphate isomerase-like protein (cupin superfamily)
MVRRIIAPALVVSGVLSSIAFAQDVGSNAYIDMYFNDGRASTPVVTHGTLEERSILKRGDALKPAEKGAVLRYINSFSSATLAPQASTASTRLDGKQEIFYFRSGHGTAEAAGETAKIDPNVAILMPAHLSFTLKNTGQEPLVMYLISEPAPPGFRPNPNMLVRDENTLPITSSDGMWSHIVKTLFVTDDGLGTLQSVLTVTFDPLTMGKPHATNHDDIEEVWAGLEGTSLALVGPFLRRQGPGVAYLHPPDNLAPHSNINYSEEDQVKFLYFARYHPHEARK